MKIGYIRVSTEEQKIERQKTLLNAVNPEKLFIDCCSGKTMDRPELQAMLAFIREGDTVIVESYSRLARSLIDLIKIVDIIKNRGAEFYSIKENSDTSTPAGKLIFNIFGALYEFERECLLERQKEGILEAKKQGKYRGRQKKDIDDDLFRKLYSEWKQGRITAVYFMDKIGLAHATFYRYIKNHEKNNRLT